MKALCQFCVGLIFLSLNHSSEAREVAVYIISNPAGATITDAGQQRSRILGKAPLRLAIDVENIDYSTGVLQVGRYTGKWPSGAVSRVLKYASPLGETEFLYVMERPVGADGEAKDHAAGEAYKKTHAVAAMNQELEAKYQTFYEKLAVIKEQHKEEVRLVEEKRQRELDEARKRDELAAIERRVGELRKRQQEAREVINQRNRGHAVAGLPTYVQGSGMDWAGARQRMADYDRDTERNYSRELACLRELRDCDY
ncbi:MAG: hypothetical protein WC681_14355 [Sterolibacterium sp.]|jgi:hypothetical protein